MRNNIFRNCFKSFDEKLISCINQTDKKSLVYLVMLNITRMFDGAYYTVMFSVFTLILIINDLPMKTPLLAITIPQIITHILKRIFERNRPFVDNDDVNLRIAPPKDIYSFPSGHTSAAFAMAYAIAISFPHFFIPALLIAFLCGLSRIYLGVHYPTDVLAGAFIPGLVYFILLKIM